MGFSMCVSEQSLVHPSGSLIARLLFLVAIATFRTHSPPSHAQGLNSQNLLAELRNRAKKEDQERQNSGRFDVSRKPCPLLFSLPKRVPSRGRGKAKVAGVRHLSSICSWRHKSKNEISIGGLGTNTNPKYQRANMGLREKIESRQLKKSRKVRRKSG